MHWYNLDHLHNLAHLLHTWMDTRYMSCTIEIPCLEGPCCWTNRYSFALPIDRLTADDLNAVVELLLEAPHRQSKPLISPYLRQVMQHAWATVLPRSATVLPRSIETSPSRCTTHRPARSIDRMRRGECVYLRRLLPYPSSITWGCHIYF